MSCQKAIDRKISEKQADYVLSLKDNQPALYKAVQEYFEAAWKAPEKYPMVKSLKTTKSGHGRSKRGHIICQQTRSGIRMGSNGLLSMPSVWFILLWNRMAMSASTRAALLPL